MLIHINKSAEVKGVYTEGRWEYPVIAIREVIRNAVVHRDYSLTGKDIKIAVFDDMVEITSPGKLLPSIDFSELEARQSDFRNKVIAPVFKKLGIIDQWGNGLKLIADELKYYPEIGFNWSEAGMQFQVQFIKKDFKQHQKLQQEMESKLQHELQHESLYGKLLTIIVEKPSSTKELSVKLGQKSISGQLKKVLGKLLEDRLVKWTEPDIAKSSRQQYKLPTAVLWSSI